MGDLLCLEEGMEVPADGIIIEANELTTDEAAMTGEPGKYENNTINKYLKIYLKNNLDPIKKTTLKKCLA